jgi:hypothetical protein
MCCINCFDDEILKERIEQEGVIEDCDYCKAKHVACVDASELQSVFEKFLDIYVKTIRGVHFPVDECIMDYGQSLHKLIQEDWHVFSDEIEDNNQYPELMKDIFAGYCDNPESELDVESEFFSRYDECMDQYTVQELWFEFCESIKNKNRFFSNRFFNGEDMANLLSKSSRIVKKDASKPLFRARNGGKKSKDEKIKPYPISQMGAPSSEKAGNGRANPKGIAYLYLATSVDTAIAEMRPVKNTKISVSKVSLLEDILIIDFSGKISSSSPFEVENLRQEWEHIHLMQQIGEYFSMPIEPALSDIEYVPTQFISEYIKSLRYDGFVFQSSLGSGLNYVIFHQKKTKISRANLYTVTDIQYKFEKR